MHFSLQDIHDHEQKLHPRRAHSTTVDFANQNDVHLLLLHGISGSSSLNYYQNTVIHKVEDEVHFLHHDNQAFDVYSEIEFPIAAKKNYGNSHLRVVGLALVMLICFADDIPSYAYNFIIRNPAIKKSVALPKPGITYQTHGGYDASIGFGFDATANDYKVVRVMTLLDEDETPTLAEVYSLATDTWSTLGCVSPACLIDKAASSAFVNGFFIGL